MVTKWIRRTAFASITGLVVLSAGCGDLARQGSSPVQVVIMALEGASGATPDELGAFVLSDVLTLVTRTIAGEQVQVPTVFNDVGEVTMQLILKDPGQAGIVTTPSALNQVTMTRYRVVFRRADGRNTPGVDVPFGFDGAATFTVPAEGSVTAGFELVRVIAKQETPLAALVNNGGFITTLADVTFFGRDQAGNAVQATGTIQVNFGNFADPD